MLPPFGRDVGFPTVRTCRLPKSDAQVEVFEKVKNFLGGNDITHYITRSTHYITRSTDMYMRQKMQWYGHKKSLTEL